MLHARSNTNDIFINNLVNNMIHKSKLVQNFRSGIFDEFTKNFVGLHNLQISLLLLNRVL